MAIWGATGAGGGGAREGATADGTEVDTLDALGRGDRKTPLTTLVSAAVEDNEGLELLLLALSVLPSYHGMLEVRALLTTSFLRLKV